MTANSPHSGDSSEYDRLLRQRDLAVVCAVLAVVMAGVILWNNFVREDAELKAAQQAKQQHAELFVENRNVLVAVHAALLANQQEVKRLGQAKSGSP